VDSDQLRNHYHYLSYYIIGNASAKYVLSYEGCLAF